MKYYVSNARAETPWQNIALAGAARWRVEECFEDGKMHLGMADYEARSWSSWHHHMALVSLAHLYVTLTKRDMKHDVPELTLDLALRVLRTSFAFPTLSEDEATDIIDYHLERNRVARESHRQVVAGKAQTTGQETLAVELCTLTVETGIVPRRGLGGSKGARNQY